MKPGKKSDRAERMKSVEREYQVAEMARAALEEALSKHSGLLTASGLTVVDLRTYRSKLHDTYFIRLFAEVENWTKGLLEERPQTGSDDPDHGCHLFGWRPTSNSRCLAH